MSVTAEELKDYAERLEALEPEDQAVACAYLRALEDSARIREVKENKEPA